MDELVDKRWRNVYAKVYQRDESFTRFEIYLNHVFGRVMFRKINIPTRDLNENPELFGYVLLRMIEDIDASLAEREKQQ